MIHKNRSIKGTSLLPLSTQKVVSTLLERPDSGYSIRELARISDVSYATAHKVVTQLCAMRAIALRGGGPRSFIEVFKRSNEVTALKLLFSAFTERLRLYAGDFGCSLMHLKGVQGCWLFGSVARGTATQESDIDILVFLRQGITETGREQVEQAIREEAHQYNENNNIHITPLIVNWNDAVHSYAFGSAFERRVAKEGKSLAGAIPWKEGKRVAKEVFI